MFPFQISARKFDMKWPGAIEVTTAIDYTMIGNCVAGSEKFGLITSGVPCGDQQAYNRVRDNEVDFVQYTLVYTVKIEG